MIESDAKSIARHKRQVRINHAIGLILVVGFSVLFINLLRGYAYDPDSGSVIRNGLVAIDSKPTGAEIYLNGEPEGEATKAKLTLPEGPHNVSLKKDGYQEWSHRIDVQASSVHDLSYIRLFADNAKQTTLALRSGFVIQDWLIMQGQSQIVLISAKAEIAVVEVNNDAPKPEYYNIANLLNEDDTALLSLDRQYDLELVMNHENTLLIKRAVDEEADEYLVYQVGSPKLSHRVTLEPDQQTAPRLMNHPSKMIVHSTKGKLQILDLEQPSGSVDIANYARGYEVIDENRILVNKPTLVPAEVASPDDSSLEPSDSDNSHVISLIDIREIEQRQHGLPLATVTSERAPALSYAGNARGEFVAIGAGNNFIIYRVNDIKASDLPLEPTLVDQGIVNSIISSPNGRYMSAVSTSSNRIYDIYDQEPSPVMSDQRQGAQSKGQPSWLNGHHLMNLVGDQLHVSDFDGNYLIAITPALSGASALGLMMSDDWSRGVMLVDNDGDIVLSNITNSP